MSWTDQNELMRLGKKMLEVTGTNTNTNANTPSEKSIISQLASYTGVGYNAARDAYVKGVLDPLLQERVRKSMNWFINANYIPKFVDGIALNTDLDDSPEGSAIKPDGIESPKRMFNIDTCMLEDWPSGQYVILSHSWKGQEITYQFISKIKASQKKREVYEMLQGESDEEAVRFGRFQSKKFKHLKAGMTDTELLSAQCTKDREEAVRKIDTLLSRSGIKSTSRELLEKLAKFKIATAEEKRASDTYSKKVEEVKQRKMSAKRPEDEKKGVGIISEESSAANEKKDSSKKLTPAEEELVNAENELDDAKAKQKTAKEQLDQAEESCEVMDQIPALRSAVEDLLLALERKKSMNKIEGSIEEARRILNLNLFPRKDRNRYLWNDTCCINKADANELNESLAMMGQWYNNADFCLVHLDTKESTEWVDTWDRLEKKADEPNFPTFKDVKEPNWATRGWTLQELVLSKMTFYVNSLWQPLSRGAEGLGPYYYHCSYLAHHIREEHVSDAPPDAKSALQDLAKLQNLMDALTEKKVEKIPYIEYKGCGEKWRRLIGILDFLGIYFPGDMDNDNSGAYIRKSISLAAYGIEGEVEKETAKGNRLTSLFTDLGFERTPVRAQAKLLIKLVVRVLVEACENGIAADREQVSKFTKVPPEECCRGLSRSSHPAQDILLLASHRECTVPIDRVYSLMGVLGVKFAAFHAEGTTKALCRLLDEVLITTNDISIFHWAGKDLGSPIRGRSLYPSNLTAFRPKDNTESQLNTKKQVERAKDSKMERDALHYTESRLTLLLRGTINFIKDPAHKDIPAADLIRKILKFIEATSLTNLQPQLENLGKLLAYVEKTQSFETEKYKPKTRSWTEDESNKNAEGKYAQIGNIASRFGIKAPPMPSMPSMPSMPQFSAPKLKVGGFPSLYGKKSAAKEPKPAKESSIAAPVAQTPLPTTQEEMEPESLLGEITAWLSPKRNLNEVPEEFKPLFADLKTTNTDANPAGQKKSTTAKMSPNDGMICPNPITLTTSGIEAVLDIQRVIIKMEKGDELRGQVESAVNDSEKIAGECTISTGLSTITVNFSCSAGELKKQLNVCDVVEKALLHAKLKEGTGRPTQTEVPPTPGEERTNLYSRLPSLPFGSKRQESETTVTTENKDLKRDTQAGETPTQAGETSTTVFGDTEEQRRVTAMLDFIQETDISLIVGEWVLARFTGADGAKWFLCQLELGATHTYYGRRIATDEIDFMTVAPEPGLVDVWNTYLNNKKAELCLVVDVLLQGKDARKYADEVTGLEKGGQSKAEGDDDSDSEAPVDPKQKLLEFIVRRRTNISVGIVQTGAGIVQSVSDWAGEKLDEMLSDTILQKVPKELQVAIMNLNQNKNLLPAMFLSGVKVHMF